MRFLVTTAVAAGLLTLSARADAQVQLTMANGQVTLSARNATVPQILAEWARIGQTRIVNAERLTGTPVTLELSAVPEAQALDILLRSAGGYLLAPRAVAAANTSAFDRILVLPPSSAPRAAAPPTPVANAQRPRPFESDEPPDAERAPINRFPQGGRPDQVTPPMPAAPASAPAMISSPTPFTPGGVARPGMMMPVPQPATPAQGPNGAPVFQPAQPGPNGMPVFQPAVPGPNGAPVFQPGAVVPQ